MFGCKKIKCRSPPACSSFQKYTEWRTKHEGYIKYIIADNVRFYRKKADLTQAGLAERAELSLDTIKRIEAGKRTMSLENFLGLSDALRIPLTFLLYEQKDRMPDEERIWGILKGRSDGQKEYLLHMLQEIADGIDRYL